MCRPRHGQSEATCPFHSIAVDRTVQVTSTTTVPHLEVHQPHRKATGERQLDATGTCRMMRMAPGAMRFESRPRGRKRIVGTDLLLACLQSQSQLHSLVFDSTCQNQRSMLPFCSVEKVTERNPNVKPIIKSFQEFDFGLYSQDEASQLLDYPSCWGIGQDIEITQRELLGTKRKTCVIDLVSRLRDGFSDVTIREAPSETCR